MDYKISRPVFLHLKFWCCLVLLFSIFLPSLLQAERTSNGWLIQKRAPSAFLEKPTLVLTLESPDGKTTAVREEYLRQNLNKSGPTVSRFCYRLLLRDSSGKVIFEDDARLADRQPLCGFWTKSGRFFVYEARSEGGHSPWHHWFGVVDAKTGKLYGDHDLVGTSLSSPKLAGDEKISYVAWLKGHTSEASDNPISTIDLYNWIHHRKGK